LRIIRTAIPGEQKLCFLTQKSVPDDFASVHQL
jgi:hypothetical protein